MGNPITPPAPSATPATTLLSNALAEFKPPAIQPPTAPAPGASPSGPGDVPPAAVVTKDPAAPAPAPVGAEEGLEFDLSVLGISGDLPADAPAEALDPATSRGKQIWADHKLLRALEAPPEEGGIGYRPTLEQIRGMAEDAKAHNTLILDLQSQTPTHNIHAINWLLRTAPKAFLDLAANLPPDMLKLAREKVLADEIQGLLEIARRYPDADDTRKHRTYWFQVANGLHYAMTGGQALDPQVLLQAPKPPESEAERLARRERAVAEREQAQARTKFEAWKAQAKTRREGAIRELVERVVQPVKASQEVKSLAVDAIVARTLDKLMGQTSLMDQVTILIRRAEASLDNDDALQGFGNQLTDLYVRGSQPIIRQEVAATLKLTTQTAAAAAAGDAAKAKQVQGDPTPAGSPNAPGGAPQPGQENGKLRPRAKGENDQQYIQSVLGNLLRAS